MAKPAQSRTQTRTRRKSRSGGTAAGQAADPVAVMMDLVAAEGWRGLTLARVAEASGLKLADLYLQYGSKNDLLAAYARRIDTVMLAALGEAPAGGDAGADTDVLRDRLFEAVMARLDALTPHKAAIRVLARELPSDPAALLCFLHGGLRRGLDWTLAAAGLDVPGPRGLLRRKLLGLVYLDTIRAWLQDDSADLGPTMSRLDKRLRQTVGMMTGRPGFFSRMRGAASEAA
jgi:AcrR family transcriptional regulator